MPHSLDLLSHLQKGAIVITPNHRLAHHLLVAYAVRYQPTHGGLAKPRCFAYSTLLQVMYKHLQQAHPYTRHPVLLNSAQENHLWWTIVGQEHPEGLNEEILQRIQEAWQDCQDWQISLNAKAFHYATPRERFARWAGLFREALQHRHAITFALLPAYLLQYPRVIPSCPMIWTCFNVFTPIQQHLQDHYKSQGHPQLYDDMLAQTITGQYYAAEDETEEYEAMIGWAAERLAAGVPTLAIVVPHLASHAAKLRHLFAQHFAREQVCIASHQPLRESPLVGAALQWIQLQKSTLTHHQLRLLLQSPYIQGSHTDYILRSRILEKTAIWQEQEVSWSLLMHTLSQSAPSLHSVLQNINTYPLEDSPSAWAEHFKLRLARLGFPGETLSSTMQQSFNCLMGLFDELMSLSLITNKMTQNDAIQTLLRLAKSAVLPVATEKRPILIIDIQEASGCIVDEMWVCRLSQDDVSPKSSPFLPRALQSTLARSSSHNSLQLATLNLDRLGYGSQAIVYSYPRLQDEITQLPSILITKYPLMHRDNRPQSVVMVDLVPFTENYLLPLQSGIAGGTALLASQAKCPFQAFASYRLQAKAPSSPYDGLNNMERGQLLHRTLEILWQQLQSQATLQRIAPEDLEAMIQNAITQSLRPLSEARPYSFAPLMQDVEQKRISQLVHQSLVFEKERTAFTIVALEKSHTIRLAGIPFRIRIDRMDRLLNDGSKIVIDYKTSLPARNPWQEDRPEAPQLLLYSLVDKDIKALLFMQLKAGRVRVHGVSTHDIPGLRQIVSEEDWSNAQERWMQQLTALATEIANGQSQPQPSHPTHCLSCSFKSLCRFKP